MADDRDVEKKYSTRQNIQKLERLIAAIAEGKSFEIQVDNERIKVPADAVFSIEHERDGHEQELEFQFRWKRAD